MTLVVGRGNEFSRQRSSRRGRARAVGRGGDAVRAAEGRSRRRPPEALPPRRRCSSDRSTPIRWPALPTDERLERVKKGETDLGLEALYFQFGRYLLIASSRPGGLPANLQGLWNDSMFPPWDSDYHLNINLQMNYWPAEVTNLAELHQPLFDYLESLREPGRKTARVHYGASGFVAHHISDIWGFTTPGDRPRSGLWPTGAAWLTQHLWEHYLFNPDRAFLAKAYPVMKEAAEFFLDYLVEDPRAPGRLVSGPSVSPENRYRLPNGQVGILSMGPSMDHQIITGLFTQVIRASEILGIDAAFRERVAATQKRIPAAGRSASTARFRNGPRTTTSPIRAIATSRSCSRCIPATRSRCTARRSSRRPRARPSSGGWRTAAATRAGAARGSSTSGRACRTASRRTRTIRRCSRSRRCRTCGTCIRRSRSTATSAAPRASPRCCCRATTARSTCCRRCRAPGPTASSPACARAAASRSMRRGRRGKLTSATLRPSISGVQKLRVPAGTTIASIRSGDLVVAFRQHADGAELRLEAGRTYEVTFPLTGGSHATCRVRTALARVSVVVASRVHARRRKRLSRKPHRSTRTAAPVATAAT